MTKLDEAWTSCHDEYGRTYGKYGTVGGNNSHAGKMMFRCLDVAFDIVNNSTDAVNQKRLSRFLVRHIHNEARKREFKKITDQNEVNFIKGIRNCTVWKGCLEHYCMPW